MVDHDLAFDPSGISITSGPVPIILSLAAVLALIWLIAQRSRRHLWTLVAAAIFAGIVYFAVSPVMTALGLSPEPLPWQTEAWIAIGVFAVIAAVSRFTHTSSGRAHAVTAVSVAVVLLAAAAGVNTQFDAYPTLRSLYGSDDIDEAAPGEFDGDGVRVVDLKDWRPGGSVPTTGTVKSVHIDPAASHFSARDGLVYLPPAYFSAPRPRLPVLVLLAGQPGSPDDWVRSVGMPGILDEYAAKHDGVAPVVIVADGTGTQWGNPACVDSAAGNAARYLTKDVHEWAEENLTVAREPAQWGVGGLSYGGTCALQLVTNHPDSYRVFLDMSGQPEPTLGDHKRTVDQLFNGDEKAFKEVNPLDIMAKRKFPETSGVFVVGDGDSEYRPGLERMYTAAKAAGMSVEFHTVPGGHSFRVWRDGFDKYLPTISHHLGIG